jgi:hypothetical protein
MALSAGRENVLLSPKPARAEVQGQVRQGVGGGLAWPGALRRLDRENPGYDA